MSALLKAFATLPRLAYLRILMVKELLQISRDKSVFAIIFLQPLLLVLIYGYGLGMDVKPLQMGVVSSYESAFSRAVVNELEGSDYFEVIRVSSLDEGEALLTSHEVKSLLYIPPGIDRDLNALRATVMLYENGAEAKLAELTEGYVSSALQQALSRGGYSSFDGRVSVVSRSWFNEANDSGWFLMSGQFIAIITLVCSFLGSFVIAREWDRGTAESLAATNATALEIVSAKLVTYLTLALTGTMVTVILGECLIGVPIRGSMMVLMILMGVYTFEMLAFGILISAVCRSQFLASEYAVIIGCLPTVLLSGLLFDLRSVAPFIQGIGYLIPPTYAVQAMRIEFLSGGLLTTVLRDIGIQFAWGVLFFVITVVRVHRDLK